MKTDKKLNFQNKEIIRSDKQNEILELEKKYFNKLNEILNKKEFKNDLLLIEKEIRENYSEFDDIWDLKNKIKIPAERLISHYVYMTWNSEIQGIYPSPVSSDVGIKMSDAVVCIDVKTIDTVGNSGDIKSTAVEKNQNSFDNRNYEHFGFKGNLKSIDHYSRKPVISLLVKIIYSDDKYSFKLSREKYPTIVLVCIPNGELSSLFNYNIIENFKTYDYYNHKKDPYWEP